MSGLLYFTSSTLPNTATPHVLDVLSVEEARTGKRQFHSAWSWHHVMLTSTAKAGCQVSGGVGLAWQTFVPDRPQPYARQGLEFVSEYDYARWSGVMRRSNSMSCTMLMVVY